MTFKTFESKASRLQVFMLEDRCVPASQVVSTDADNGPGSLRDAITIINTSLDSNNEISFSSYFSTAKTITLGAMLPGISVPLKINGTVNTSGAPLVTISGGGVVSLFDTTPANLNSTIEFKNLILSDGYSSDSDQGGAITADDENITLTNCTVMNNTAKNGGAVYLQGDQTLRVQNSRVTGNASTSTTPFEGGGAFFLFNIYSNLTIDNSTISGNSAEQMGGAANMYLGGNLSLTNSTISGNSAGVSGGGIYSFNLGYLPKSFLVRNSTIAGNTSAGTGSALCVISNNFGTVDIVNSTISGNTSGNTGFEIYGGAIAIRIAFSEIVNIVSSVVSENVHKGGNNNDLSIDPTAILNIDHSAIGTNSGFTITGSNTNNLPFGANLKLGPLADNGGATPTMAISDPESPLINAGSNPTNQLTDQRGGAFQRVVGSAADIGAFEYQTPPATATVSNIVVNGGATQRSTLKLVQVNFTQSVPLAQFQAPGAVFFTRTGIATNNVESVGTVVDLSNGLIIQPVSGNSSSITLTFQNIDNAGIDFGSLSDGRWQLTIVPANYSSPDTPTDTQLRRLFGNFDNDTQVGATDFGFYPPFGASPGNPFDFNNDGSVQADDFGEFGNRYGFTLI